ncbi:uncharacterized protein LOC142584392 [Dermacentor variabilis]|uniref:uncharacterized protein LOC142584392 n=1 Tax=Dermacentor variabilis TaxID=34621 RepID=UPI003F5B5F10
MDKQHSQHGDEATPGQLQEPSRRGTEKTGTATTAEVRRLNGEASVQPGNLQTNSGRKNGPAEVSEKEPEDTKQPSRSQAEERGDAAGGMNGACCIDCDEPVGMSGKPRDICSQEFDAADGTAAQANRQGTSQPEPGPTGGESCRARPDGIVVNGERLQQLCDLIRAMVRAVVEEELQSVLQDLRNNKGGA